MRLLLQREPTTDDVTLGTLYVNGVKECWCLEDAVRPVKINDQTAIPAGTYQVVITRSQRFAKMLPLLLDVPNFTGIRIHSGNTAEDTSGCILVGQRLLSPDPPMIGDSRYAMGHLQPQIADALAHGEEVWIEIRDATRKPPEVVFA